MLAIVEILPGNGRRLFAGEDPLEYSSAPIGAREVLPTREDGWTDRVTTFLGHFSYIGEDKRDGHTVAVLRRVGGEGDS